MADRRQLYKYKGDQCVHCQLRVEDMIEQWGSFKRIFEFNHIDPTKKHPDYENLIQRVISTEQLDEVDKCVLMCSNCHRIIHEQNLNAEVQVTVTLGEKKASQRFKGQLIVDRLQRHGRFFTDQRVLVYPYMVYIGKNEPRIMFGTELDDGELSALIMDIPKHKTIAIRGWDGTLLMVAEDLSNGEFKLQHSLEFPLLRSELHGSNESPIIQMWVRNGFALTRDGEVITEGTLTIRGNLPKD